MSKAASNTRKRNSFAKKAKRVTDNLEAMEKVADEVPPGP